MAFFGKIRCVVACRATVWARVAAVTAGLRGALGVAVLLACVFAAPTRVEAQIDADRVVNIGRNALYFDDYVVAIQYFNQAIATKPYLAKPYFYRAIAKLNLEDYRGAEEDASRAIELNEFIADAWEVRGVARQNMGDNEGAVADYNHALRLVPRNRQLMFNMAMARTRLKDYDTADSLFTSIIEYFPGNENAYLGRAQVRLERADTIGAMADIDTALVKNPDSFNGHVMRAQVLMSPGRPLLRTALADMDRAIKLEPRIAGLYINRAYIRYNLQDWDGAFSDYDYALSLEPLNITALFNRGMLNAEAGANDRALDDFSAVLALDPDDHRAHYNRALVLARKRDFKGAIADIDAVIALFPDFPAGYFLRSDFEKGLGNMTRAAQDYDKAMKLTANLHPVDGRVDAPTFDKPTDQQLTEKEFAQLLTVDDNTDRRQEYNNTAIRGRLQDRNISIEAEGPVELAYYSSPTELSENSFYIKEVDDINRTRQLRFAVLATINPPQLRDEEDTRRHFSSIDYYNSYLASHRPRAIDYIGRAMDFVTLRDYASAIADIDRAIALNPDFAPAYMLRAQAALRLHKAGIGTATADATGRKVNDSRLRLSLDRKAGDDILADIDRAIELSPLNPYLYYNRAVALIDFERFDEAIQALDRAIELAPDFGPAYYNRGFVHLKLGSRAQGIDDLSRAGELGVVAAYNLIKRISQ